ncbi:hypothetical protein [Endozoicomonas elysicola]|uniref:Uncharacterized protein n=1 Tax=Endozoicomonas elysicola TaxID=305900 RepID=A0A081K821_9GAMM|nr:hypothetical protein [Endozoicomonas elysicola]KEI70297.1 hypothetical protein GV64_05695 [Endozoicomonas elysicola]
MLKAGLAGFAVYVSSMFNTIFVASRGSGWISNTIPQFIKVALSNMTLEILFLHLPYYFVGIYVYKLIARSTLFKKMLVITLLILPVLDTVIFRGLTFSIFAFPLAFGYGVSEVKAIALVYSVYAIFLAWGLYNLNRRPSEENRQEE